MQKSCTQCSASFEITNEDLALLDKISPEFGGVKHALPPPTMCFECRLQRRLAFYNCRTLYRRTCSRTEKQIISVFSPEKPFTVYAPNLWWSDEWDPMDYGREFDFSRPFFEQARELMEDVPCLGQAVFVDSVNCEFANDMYKSKNCYLVFDGEQAQDCYYGQTFTQIQNCIDFVYLYSSELCYECTHCEKCYALRCSRYCTNCSDSWFLRDCIGCKNCFGCANARQKEYCVFNEQKTKEEYETFMREFRHSSFTQLQKMRQRAEDFFQTQPVRALRGQQNINCLGDNLSNCQNAYWCFDCLAKQDCRYFTDGMMPARDCMDIHIWGDQLELAYNCALVGAQASNVIAGYYILIGGCDRVYYSQWCTRGCRNVFGCIGLQHKEYCIFNKQYGKEEYESLVTRIIEHMKETGEWGEYYPPEISAFGYNETMAQMFLPMTKDEVLAKGWQWCDEEVPVNADKTIPAHQLPDDSSDTPDDVLNWAIVCEVTGKPFKIIKQELDFYRKHKLPLPRKHPDQRNKERYACKNPYKLWTRKCDKCARDIQSAYQPSRPETVYCEECYLATVY